MNYLDYKIAIILGTRAELIKTFPVMLELKKRKIPYYFIHTGQHNLEDLCDQFKVKRPDVVLTPEPIKSSKFNNKNLKGIIWNLNIVYLIRKELKRTSKLKFVLYHGDTMTTTSAAIASSRFLNLFKKYKNVHLEAGLRSGNIFEPLPEEISRKISGKFSDVLFAVSKLSKSNLKKYDKNKTIILVGNTIIDSANIAYEMAKKSRTKLLHRGKFALISIHRHENIASKKRMQKIVNILGALKIPSFFPLHHNTMKMLENYGLLEILKKNKNIKIIEPMDYVPFIFQIANCSLIICDGGSLQEESLIFNKPCIILRKATERQEGLIANFQYLSKLDVEKTKEKIEEYCSNSFKLKKINNPYGKRGVSIKIVDILEHK